MRNVIIISIFFLSIVSGAQSNDSISKSEKEYFELLNHTPKNFKIDNENKPSSKFLKTDLNSIWKLKNAYKLKEKLNDNEVKWLEDQINQLAVAYFLEKQPIILENVGGFSGCPEQLVSIKLKNKRKVTVLSFCYGGCISSGKTDDFIRIFNNRTEKLLLNLK